VAAGGAAMASSAGCDKKGGTIFREIGRPALLREGGSHHHQFHQHYRITPRVPYAVALRHILIPLFRMAIVPPGVVGEQGWGNG